MAGNKSLYWDAINLDRVYYSQDLADLLARYFTNGVFNNSHQVVASGSMQLTVKKGSANLRGRMHIDDDVVINIANADGSLPRIDRVVLREDRIQRITSVVVIQGTPASSPVIPPLVRNNNIFDLALANVTIPAGAIGISQSNVSDQRFTADCGNVVQAVQTADFNDLWIQFEQEFNDWLTYIKTVLDGDIIGQLIIQIESLLDKVGASVPIGGMLIWSGIKTKIPADYLPAEGQSLLVSEYQRLFDMIGYTYGGSGANFNLPDMRDRVVAGVGSDTNFNTLGKKSGSSSHTLTEAEIPSHTHLQDAHNHRVSASGAYMVANGGVTIPTVAFTTGTGNNAVVSNATTTYSTVQLGASTTATNQNTGSGTAHNNVQPTMAQFYIIKVIGNPYTEDVRDLDAAVTNIKDDLSYSYVERKTCKKWLDGSPIYRKTIHIPSLPNTAVLQYPHGISNIKYVITISGFSYATATGAMHATLPITNPNNIVSNISLGNFSTTGIYIDAGDDRSMYSACVTIEYTKTTD